MTNLICSIAIRKNILAILVIEDGMIKSRTTERIRSAKALASSYSAIIYAFTVALRYVRGYTQGKGGYNVCFETSNSTFIKWVNNQYSKEAYQDEFLAALRLMQEIPIRYAFSYSPKPKAFAFVDEKYCKKARLGGLDIDGVDDE